MEGKLSNIKYNPFTEANKMPNSNQKIDIGLDIDIDQDFGPDDGEDNTSEEDEFMGFDEDLLI